MKKILIVGATNIDIVAKPKDKIVLYDKNPGVTRFSYGGVARNICENLARLNVGPTFVTIVGNDIFGENAIAHLEELGTDIVFKTANESTSTFTSFLNENNENYLSISSMDIVDHLNEEFLSAIDFNAYDLVVGDINNKDAIKFITENSKKCFIDATSEAKAPNLKEYLSKIDYLKCTKEEMYSLFNTTELESVIKDYPNITIVVTNRDENVYYNDGKEIMYSNIDKKEKVVNAIGSGDSFSSGFIYGLLNDMSLAKSIEIAKACAAHTIQSEETVSSNLNLDIIKDLL